MASLFFYPMAANGDSHNTILAETAGDFKKIMAVWLEKSLILA
jgi:hypothetical protein